MYSRYWHDLPHVAGWAPHHLHLLLDRFPGLDLYFAHPAYHAITAGEIFLVYIMISFAILI